MRGLARTHLRSLSPLPDPTAKFKLFMPLVLAPWLFDSCRAFDTRRQPPKTLGHNRLNPIPNFKDMLRDSGYALLQLQTVLFVESQHTK